MHRTSWVLVVAMLAILLSPAAPGAHADTDRGPRLPRYGALFGAYVAVDPRTGPTRQEAMANFEDEMGRTMAIDRVYYGWDTEFLTNAADLADRAAGRTIVVSWGIRTRDGQIVKWRDIASGVEDDQIDRHAALAIAFGAPVFLIFNHEAERYRNGGGLDAGTSAEFVRAYQHIHDRFEADGVTNVSWVLTLLACTYGESCAGDNQEPPDNYYPGDEYVDLLGADGYNFYGCKGTGWRTFDSVFGGFYAYGVSKDKPMMVAEWGSTEDTADLSRKADFIGDGASLLADTMPQIKVMAYFHGGDGCSTIWADSSTKALNAFRTMGSDPYFNPSG